MTITIPPLTPFEWASRKLTESTLDRYFIGTAEINGYTKIVMPHLDTDGTPLGYTTRTPNQRDFRTVGKPSPFGMHLLGNHDTLFICEGHTDTLSMAQIYPDADVIGLPGAATVAYLKGILSKLKKYTTIYICPDPDVAGEEMREALLDLLPASKTRSVVLDKDISDYLMSDSVEALQLCVTLAATNAKSPFVTKDDLMGFSDMEDSIPTGLGALDTLLGGGLERRALTILTGESGKGKSSLAAQVALNVSNTHKVLYIAGGMAPVETIRTLVRMKLGRLPRTDEFAQVASEVLDRILVAKYVEDIHSVIDTIDQAVMDHGVSLVIIDVLSDITSFDVDYKVASIIVSTLAKHCKGTEDRPGYALLSVGHTKGEVEGYVTLNDVRGGKAVVQKAAPIIGISEIPGRPNARILYPIKRPRNGGLDYTTEPTRIIYERQRFKYYSEEHDDTQETQDDLRLTVGAGIPQHVPTSNVPSETIPVPDTQDTRVGNEGETETTARPVHEVHTGFLGSTIRPIHRNEGVHEGRFDRPSEVEGDDSTVSRTQLDAGDSNDSTGGSTRVVSREEQGTPSEDINELTGPDSVQEEDHGSGPTIKAEGEGDSYIQWARVRLAELGIDPELITG